MHLISEVHRLYLQLRNAKQTKELKKVGRTLCYLIIMYFLSAEKLWSTRSCTGVVHG